MGLLFMWVAGWGWVAEIGSRGARCAHHPKNPQPISGMQAYIAYFLSSKFCELRHNGVLGSPASGSWKSFPIGPGRGSFCPIYGEKQP